MICTSFRREVRVLIWFLYSSSRWLAYGTVTWTLCILIWKFTFLDPSTRLLFFPFLILCRQFDFFYLSRYFLSRLSYTFCGRTRCIKTSANPCIHFTLPWKILRYFSYMVLPFFLQRFFCPVITFAVCMSLEKPGFWCARRKTRTRVLNERVVMRQIVEICSFDYNWIINKPNSLFSSDIAIVIFYGMKIISSIIFRGEITPKMKKRRSLLYK